MAGPRVVGTDEDRPAEWSGMCDGTTEDNGLDGEGIVDTGAADSAR